MDRGTQSGLCAVGLFELFSPGGTFGRVAVGDVASLFDPAAAFFALAAALTLASAAATFWYTFGIVIPILASAATGGFSELSRFDTTFSRCSPLGVFIPLILFNPTAMQHSCDRFFHKLQVDLGESAMFTLCNQLGCKLV